jgi:hypothetical protein
VRVARTADPVARLRRICLALPDTSEKPLGVQELLVDPKRFFVPPYVGGRGWAAPAGRRSARGQMKR